ncbi:Hsp20/alpha crystallin family protein [Roseovarius sp. TE539]|uniref:Hsp20/alpha crystallin family protein n=1 Tax=Roseovarius sp. TE539 TaxID=2249812 RepID=UPI000DDCA195|nr:Hsp20/alpha crystallin family protein [Roseovarius sp. TE539]RBI70533.1 Hsp20/alpha crystallin family protein [Roseovarius sp. TE539]
MVEKSHTAGLWPSIYEPFRSMGHRMAEWLAPASDASSNDDNYRISMELPGVSEKDIDLSVHDGVVTVKGEKSDTREEKGDTWYFTERQYGAFSRSFRLPVDADGDNVQAELRDGVLEISVPKRGPDNPEARKIEISKG